MRLSIALLLAGAFLANSTSAQSANPSSPVHRWTLEDIVTVPAVTELALSSDAAHVLFVTQAADLKHDQSRSRMVIASLLDHRSKTVVDAADIEHVARIPGQAAWSALMDIGQGLQLYRIDVAGKVRPLLMQPASVTVGAACGAVPRIPFNAPMDVGVLSYAWSPDGHWLWYARLRPMSGMALKRNEEVTAQQFYPCPIAHAVVELRLRGPGGKDILVTSRSTTDRMAFGYNGFVEWDGGKLRYSIEDQLPDGSSTITNFAFDLTTHKNTRLADPSRGFATDTPGPGDSTLATQGYGMTRDLIQKMADGSSRNLGVVDFTLGDPRASKGWRARDRKSVLVGSRALTAPRYGLEYLGETDRHTVGGSDSSLDTCDFSEDLSVGACVQQSMSQSPQIVRVSPRSGEVTPIVSVSPRHDAITPLKVTPRLWTSHLGYKATGFIVWPRNYVAGRRYPAIIVTHGSDSDERFAFLGLQWNYPVQVMAERGYLVVLMNDPLPGQSAELMAAYAAWSGADNGVPPSRVRQLVWLNGVASFEDAIRDLSKEGLVDQDRVGIAGYSRGSQMTEVTMTHSTMFRAASSGDGDYLDPSSYWPGRTMSDRVFGGSPYGPAIEAYRELSPSLRAPEVKGAILQQLAETHRDALAFHRALAAAHVPAEIELYPGEASQSFETHEFHIPSNRLHANAANMAWFDIWLSDLSESTEAKLARWRVWNSSNPLKATTPANQN